LGLRITRADDEMRLDTDDSRRIRAGEKYVRRMRASFCVLGPLLARRGRAVVPLPGGCNIGTRPVDLHLKGLAALGADLRLEHGCIEASARRLRGADIDLSGPHGSTVAGTANVLSAATLARGETLIHGAAVEPEIVDLGRFLTALGAKIEGVGTPLIRVRGVDQLGGASHRLIPDRIEAATLLMAAAITGGSALVADMRLDHNAETLRLLADAGAEIQATEDRVFIKAPNRLRAVDLTASPYPGAPTDVQALWTALMATADGTSVVRDRVFPNRFQHLDELIRLGADVARRDDAAAVVGVAQLGGARVSACDLRAGAALVLAGLAAKGSTLIEGVRHIDRGYERLDLKLCQLGALINRLDHHQCSGTRQHA
jgi:UDP-N-acetylglucosamine 1-carboxyvinyltransferase